VRGSREALCHADEKFADAKLSELPRRRTDGALILDTEEWVLRLKAQQQPPVLVKRCAYPAASAPRLLRALSRSLRREDGNFEKQFRYASGAGLLFAYRSEEAGHLVYFLPDALTTYTRSEAPNDAQPVPPCIQRSTAGGAAEAVQVALLLEERAKSTAFLRIEADAVTIAVTTYATGCSAELLDLMARALGCRPAQLAINKGWSDTSRMLIVTTSITPRDVHERVRAALVEESAKGAKAYAGGGGGGAIP
jgi:hypothetical protein